MTLYIAPSLAGLAPPAAVEAIDFEAIVAARLADLAQRCDDRGIPDVAAILQIEGEPLTIGQETDAQFEENLRQRVNEAVRAVLIVSSTGSNLDQLAFTLYNATRLAIVPNPRPLATNPEDWEDDDTFRDRAVLSMEARSVAGPEGAYVYRVLTDTRDLVTGVSPILDVRCYGEEDGALYADGTPVLAPEILLVVLARAGDGTADADLLTLAVGAANPKTVRPIGDRVTVEPAAITSFKVRATIAVPAGTDATPLIAWATANVWAYVGKRRLIDKKIQTGGLNACLKVTDDEDQELLEPLADIDPGSKGATYCTDVQITPTFLEETWRS